MEDPTPRAAMEDPAEKGLKFSPGAENSTNVPTPPPSPDSDRSNADDGTDLSLMVPNQKHEKKSIHREDGASKYRMSEFSPSPDADVSSSNDGTDDSTSSGSKEGKTSKEPVEGGDGKDGSGEGGIRGEGNLPYPLSEEILEKALSDLPVGVRLAATTCINCWRAKTFPTKELLSFLKSISEHSPVLAQVLKDYKRQEGKRDKAAEKDEASHGEKRKRSSSFSGSTDKYPSSEKEDAHMPPTAAEIREGLMNLDKAIKDEQEGAGRQGIKAEDSGEGSGQPRPDNHTQTYEQTEITAEIKKRAGVQASDRLRKVLPKLRAFLPEVGQENLLELIRKYLDEKLKPEEFAEELKLLVDEHQFVLPNDEADIPKGPRCIWLPPTTPDGRARRATPSLVHSMHLMQRNNILGNNQLNILGNSSQLNSISSNVPSIYSPHSQPRSVKRSKGAGDMWVSCDKHASDACSKGTGDSKRDPIQPVPSCPLCLHETITDMRWVCCSVCKEQFHQVCAMYCEALNEPFVCPREQCQLRSPGSMMPRIMSSCLADSPLGDYLTAKAREVTSAGMRVIVKVVADVWRCSSHPLTRRCPYRSKAVFAFLQVDGGEVMLFGMYVREFGLESYHANQGRAFVQCIDSTPLYGNEKGEERQEVLTAILCGYFEFARSMGFVYVHLYVPPPTDENAFIFASRSLHVRLRACIHLAHWYRRLLEASVSEIIIHSFQASPDCTDINFPPSVFDPEEAGAEVVFRSCLSQPLHQLLVALNGCYQSAEMLQFVANNTERFFVVNLLTPGRRVLPVPAQPSLALSSPTPGREDFVYLCEKEGYMFHNLLFARYSTMMIVRHFAEEQRVATVLENPARNDGSVVDLDPHSQREMSMQMDMMQSQKWPSGEDERGMGSMRMHMHHLQEQMQMENHMSSHDHSMRGDREHMPPDREYERDVVPPDRPYKLHHHASMSGSGSDRTTRSSDDYDLLASERGMRDSRDSAWLREPPMMRDTMLMRDSSLMLEPSMMFDLPLRDGVRGGGRMSHALSSDNLDRMDTYSPSMMAGERAPMLSASDMSTRSNEPEEWRRKMSGRGSGGGMMSSNDYRLGDYRDSMMPDLSDMLLYQQGRQRGGMGYSGGGGYSQSRDSISISAFSSGRELSSNPMNKGMGDDRLLREVRHRGRGGGDLSIPLGAPM